MEFTSWIFSYRTFLTGLTLYVAGSHWEKRLLMNEIMTGSVDTRSVVSAMTLALLEDSGWYKANYSMAEQLDWGQNQGTEFLISRCDAWNGAYHCNSTHSSGCTYNREAEGYCPIEQYNNDLPAWARYFPEPNKGKWCPNCCNELLFLWNCMYSYWVGVQVGDHGLASIWVWDTIISSC